MLHTYFSFSKAWCRHGHYGFYEVKAIVKAIIGPKNLQSQWSWQFFSSKNFSSQLLGQIFGQINGQVNCQVNYVKFGKKKYPFFSLSIIVIFWLILVDYDKSWPRAVKLKISWEEWDCCFLLLYLEVLHFVKYV